MTFLFWRARAHTHTHRHQAQIVSPTTYYKKKKYMLWEQQQAVVAAVCRHGVRVGELNLRRAAQESRVGPVTYGPQSIQ